MKLFVAGMVHETNSFSPLPTSEASFAELELIRRGDADALPRIEAMAELGGVLAASRRSGDTWTPGLFAQAQPSGPLARGEYERLRDELLADLRAALIEGIDAVVLILHGAMLAEGYPDCEGDLLGRVRAIVGPSMPVGALLDLHCNLSAAMVDSGALLISVKEYPHIDYAARGEELHALLTRMLDGSLAKPRAQWLRVPMLGIFGTTEGPMRGFVQRLQAVESLPGLLSVSALHGFPWSDTEHTGGALLVYSEDTPPLASMAQQLLQELGQSFYALRESASARRMPLAQALDEAERSLSDRGPVIVGDGSDNPGGAAACDSTFILRALLDRGLTERVALGMFWDPQAVAIATAAGPGARLALRIGGKVGPMSGDPVDLEVEVLACRPDARQRGLTPGGFDALGAAVAVRSTQGLTLILNSIRQQVFSPDCFTELGVDPAAQRLVVVKSTQHFRAGFDPIAAATIYADAPGTLQADLSLLPYRHLQRPMWPLDR
ncbi:M81 family metallopeptidase [Pelomonas sp. KK5]|uniref:M81 family metallopeptidase n=1 Tax=Pelomonas sp. KK5 TaxID=1855730 RepID=UPI00097BDD3F|nr:M81 family metallopeptidase [Pelomonas sp. KK5]